MSFKLFGDGFHSIRHGAASLFSQPIGVGMGDLLIDLVSAPLPVGQHTLALRSTFGDVEIFVPAYVELVANIQQAAGDLRYHDGLTVGRRIHNRLANWFGGNDRIPEFAPPSPGPIRIELSLKKLAGDVHIYRLPEIIQSVGAISANASAVDAPVGTVVEKTLR